MTTYIEYVGVFVCGVLSGVAAAIQIAETMGVLKLQPAVAGQQASGSADESTEATDSQERVPAVKRLRRRTPWRKVKARYEAEHRRTRQSVEERVQEMERR